MNKIDFSIALAYKNLEKMMNGVALFLILGSVISGSVWSPKLSESNQNPNIILKEGHSVVVVENIGQGKESNTKISIYPKDYYDSLEKVGEAKEAVSENVDKMKEVAGEGSNKVMDGVHKVQEVAGEGSSKVKDGVHKVKEAVSEESSKVKDGAYKIKEVVGERSREVKDAVKDIERNVSMIGDTMIEATRMNSVLGVVQLLGFSMSFGMSMWMTFVWCYILGDALPREQFGMLQSRLYPVYYKIQAYCTGVALIAHLFSRGKKIVSSRAEIFYLINLVLSLLMSFGNFLYLEPKATQIMSERFKVEKEGREGVTFHPRSGIADDAGDPVSATTEQQGEVKAETHTSRLSQKLQMINRISSHANTVTLISLSMHMLYLGLQIQDSDSERGGFGRASGAFGGPPPS